MYIKFRRGKYLPADILGVIAIEFLSRTSSKELSTKAATALNHAQLPSATFRGKQVILNRAKIQVHLARLPQNWEEKDRGTERYVDKRLSTRSLHSDIPRGGLFCHLELMQRWLL